MLFIQQLPSFPGMFYLTECVIKYYQQFFGDCCCAVLFSLSIIFPTVILDIFSCAIAVLAAGLLEYVFVF